MLDLSSLLLLSSEHLTKLLYVLEASIEACANSFCEFLAGHSFVCMVLFEAAIVLRHKVVLVASRGFGVFERASELVFDA
ncbi:hypothetical protein HDU98_002870 [Podochytrium sp. JEL0797]|nr:hypothetical protein HDU98_002870 [Podochytrium sp. JEL0797]